MNFYSGIFPGTSNCMGFHSHRDVVCGGEQKTHVVSCEEPVNEDQERHRSKDTAHRPYDVHIEISVTHGLIESLKSLDQHFLADNIVPG